MDVSYDGGKYMNLISGHVSSMNFGTNSVLPKACWIARNVIKNCMLVMFYEIFLLGQRYISDRRKV